MAQHDYMRRLLEPQPRSSQWRSTGIVDLSSHDFYRRWVPWNWRPIVMALPWSRWDHPTSRSLPVHSGKTARRDSQSMWDGWGDRSTVWPCALVYERNVPTNRWGDLKGDREAQRIDQIRQPRVWGHHIPRKKSNVILNQLALLDWHRYRRDAWHLGLRQSPSK